jgi:hypothetical protein
MDALLERTDPADEQAAAELRRALDDAEQARYLREWRERHARQPHGWARLAAWLHLSRGVGA